MDFVRSLKMTTNWSSLILFSGDMKDDRRPPVPPYLTRFGAGSSITEYLFCRLGNAYSLRFMKRKNSCSNECPSNKPPSAEVLQKTLAQIQEQLASTETLLQQRTNETNYYIQVRSDDRHLRKHFVRLLATVLSSPSCIRGYAPRPPPAPSPAPPRPAGPSRIR
jgi:hypothetical protein